MSRILLFKKVDYQLDWNDQIDLNDQVDINDQLDLLTNSI